MRVLLVKTWSSEREAERVAATLESSVLLNGRAFKNSKKTFFFSCAGAWCWWRCESGMGRRVGNKCDELP